MSHLLKHIQTRYRGLRDGRWQKLYWAIDLHGTIIPSSRDKKEEILDSYPYAISTLRQLTALGNHDIILWTATDPDIVWNTVIPWFNSNAVRINFHNENPDCKSDSYARFSGKFYFDILLDDKAGFNVSSWEDIYKEVMTWR